MNDVAARIIQGSLDALGRRQVRGPLGRGGSRGQRWIEQGAVRPALHRQRAADGQQDAALAL